MFPNIKLDLTANALHFREIFVWSTCIHVLWNVLYCLLLCICVCLHVCVCAWYYTFPIPGRSVCGTLDVIQRDRWGFHLAFTLSQVAGSSHCLSLTVQGIYTFVTLKTHKCADTYICFFLSYYRLLLFYSELILFYILIFSSMFSWEHEYT